MLNLEDFVELTGPRPSNRSRDRQSCPELC